MWWWWWVCNDEGDYDHEGDDGYDNIFDDDDDGDDRLPKFLFLYLNVKIV